MIERIEDLLDNGGIEMRVEEIAVRQEVRQMLNEAGINKNTLKDMAKEVLKEEVEKACTQALHEKDIDGIVARKIDYNFGEIVRKQTKESIKERINSVFNRMTISVDITDKNGTSSITR